MRVTFVRHGQSTGNAGLPTPDLVAMPLTALGVAQAAQVARDWVIEPSHIVSSPFLRARQTAEPSCVRFPGVPMAIWAVHEFTYLAPARWAGTTREERRPSVLDYWERGDPAYVDGEGAESFSQVLRRAEGTLARLAALPGDAEVFVFSHGQFMQAVRQTVGLAGESDADKMAQFWPFDQRAPVLNCQRMQLHHAEGLWRIVAEEPVAAPELVTAVDRGTAHRHPHGLR